MSETNAVLEVCNLGVTYRRRNPLASPTVAVTDVSLRLFPGQVVGLAGPNGAGKTSVLEACLGTLHATDGRVLWFGRAHRDQRVKAAIGFCADVPVFPQRLTGREVLWMHAAIAGLEGVEARHRITEYAERLHLSAHLDARVENMSRGTVQRLGVLQALIGRHEILLCDETFAPLDPLAQMDIRDVFREEARRGAAVLVSSHQLEQLPKLVDKLLIMNGGRITRTLLPQTLQAKHLMVWRATMSGPPADDLIRKVYPESWRCGDHLFAPCPSAEPGRGGCLAALEECPPGLQFVGYRNFSLEEVFRDAVR